MDLTQIAEVVLALCEADGVESTDDLTRSRRPFWSSRRIGAKAVEAYLSRRKLWYQGSARPCACGRSQRFVERRFKMVRATPLVSKAPPTGPDHLYRESGRSAGLGPLARRGIRHQLGRGRGGVQSCPEVHASLKPGSRFQFLASANSFARG